MRKKLEITIIKIKRKTLLIYGQGCQNYYETNFLTKTLLPIVKYNDLNIVYNSH